MTRRPSELTPTKAEPAFQRPSESELGDYLRARRALVQPEAVGLPRESNRRVKGLRRDEVAAIAAISCDYYLRLEQGRDRQPSDQVLRGIGRALLLDEHALTYAARLAHPDARVSVTTAVHSVGTDPTHDAQLLGLLDLLDQWAATPAYITDRNQDIVMANEVAGALSGGTLKAGANCVLTVFSPGVRQTALDWPSLALSAVAALRYHGRSRDLRFAEVVATLWAAEPEFRHLWARHDAYPLTFGPTVHHIDGAGLVSLRYQSFAVPSTDHTLTIIFGEPGTEGSFALAQLAARVTSAQFSMPAHYL
ncbi:helix-turn-helix domain-containing protein [Subtercola lobariae]|uniref:Transcriptional regulator n=1 Tax=Subtercola lobariae TaxID=1588641 RepID=A0A917B2Q5_9MICO|nr:helix-turn-helix transcriptional regulator [Subtercola lobariae]GGF16129.1 transcriptional regulator [Subtercola lobariae]